jgi:hypothetical protein
MELFSRLLYLPRKSRKPLLGNSFPEEREYDRDNDWCPGPNNERAIQVMSSLTYARMSQLAAIIDLSSEKELSFIEFESPIMKWKETTLHNLNYRGHGYL